MEEYNYSFEIALELVQKQIFIYRNDHLTLQEIKVLEAAWYDLSYEDISDQLYLSSGYVRNIASNLWKTLTLIFNHKLAKISFRYIISQILSDQDVVIPLELTEDEDYITEYKGYIFIVDDEVNNLKVLSKILRNDGYKVYCASKIKEVLLFLDNCRKIPIDVFLIDIMMPDLDGYELCKIIKNTEHTLEIPIIFISALTALSDKVKAFKYGGNDYITKPFQEEEVLVRVSNQVTIYQQKLNLKQEIQRYQTTVEMLYQSRSILANILNNSIHGIATFETIRSPSTGDIVDFKSLLINPSFAKHFHLDRHHFLMEKTASQFFEQINPQWLQLFIKVVITGQSFQEILTYQTQNYKITAIKLGDGIYLTTELLTMIK